ncbi:hypothetical protein NS220_07500 [Microbacterium testaceum]|uniref:Uncharacterized protein n=1 Tax=Microbacterium testaceum TaxID=2033 RepID=A0A147EXW4_MICTE|nr:hypothetical protein [Microbacterium testaceum]KTR94950.1 hypothetical protein NS220_07500 [Microbacterium testaceum]
MTLRADSLLAGPRGRRLCLEVLRLAPDDDDAREAARAVSWAAGALDENTGTIVAIGGAAASFTEPAVSPADAAAALSRVEIPVLSDALLSAALAIAVDRAAYWQPPYGEDVLAATDELREVLEPVAVAVAGAPAIEWWESGVDRDTQAMVRWENSPASTESPQELSGRWRSEQVAEEVSFARRINDVRLSGSWWSTPAFALPRSTRVRGTAGPVGLTLVEDSWGWTSARVRPIAAPDGEVIEVDGPESWAELCRRHPFPVTASRRNVWGWATGREGMWVQPDWAAVAAEAAGVHLSVEGYLSTAGRVIDLGDLGASTVAGWGPDETFWFSPVEHSAPEREWVRDGDTWTRA